MKHVRENNSRKGKSRIPKNSLDFSEMKPVVARPDHVPDHRDLVRRKRNHGLIGALMVLFLVAAVGGVGLYLYNDMQTRAETQRIVEQREKEAQEAKEAAEAAAAEEAAQSRRDALHNVSFSVSGVDYDQYATRIPLHVVGQSVAGQEFDEIVFVDYRGVGLSVPAGTYTATVAASPLARSGMIYTITSPPMEFTIEENDPEDVAPGRAIVLLPIEADKLTQDDINAAYEWALKDDQSVGNAETYKQAAEVSMVESKERKKRAQAEDRLRRAQEFTSEYFTTVMFTNQDNDAEVTPIGNWTDVVMAYVRDNTKLAEALKKGPVVPYSTAANVGTPSADEKDKTVTVPVEVARTKEVKQGWSTKTFKATVVCTFDDDNLITKIKVTTPDGSKEY